jgi:trk system potassium uptake protein TrkA
VPYVVARIYDPRRAVIYRQLGIATVAAVSWTTDQVLRRLFPEKSVAEWTDASGSVSLLERALPDSWAGRKLSEMEEPGRFRVVALTRGGMARLYGPELVGQEGDILHLAVRNDSQEELEARMSAGPESTR